MYTSLAPGLDGIAQGLGKIIIRKRREKRGKRGEGIGQAGNKM
jgi:hypothetical protein